MIKLGSPVMDCATQLPGMVTHMQVEMNKSVYYLFQPRGLSPETGEPVKGLWVVGTRLQGGETIPMPALPLEVIGTEVEDRASGFAGVAVSICLHISGCVHVSVQPKGRFEKTGAAVCACDFDIRRLQGAAIKPMTEQEREADQAEKPSPGPLDRYTPRTPVY